MNSAPVASQQIIVGGFSAPGYERVAEEFIRNFRERGELGAGFAAVRDGAPIVDIWGGVADRQTGRMWRSDTVQNIFSGGKGMVAVCMLLLIERGQLELEQPVSAYWPEFARAGKHGVRVRHVVSHTAGLPGVRRRLTLADAIDGDLMARLLADEPPYATAGAALQYHRLTYGWICRELVRRVDGRTLARFFADEVAVPLGLDAWIGIPAAIASRTAVVELADDWGQQTAVFSRAATQRDPLMATVWANPPMYDPADFHWNDRALRAAEIPAAGAIAAVRSLAKLYGCLASRGEIDGVRLLEPDTVELGRRQLSRGEERWLRRAMAFGVGFALQTDARPLGPPYDAFGHSGAGGSVHGAWPDLNVGFSYAPNLMRDDEYGRADGRAAVLLKALHAAVLGADT